MKVTVQDAETRVNTMLWGYSVLVWFANALAWTTYWMRPHVTTRRPLFVLDDQFHDLTNYKWKIAHLHDGAGALGRGVPVFNYPAPAAYVYKVLLGFGDSAPQAYILFLASFVLFLAFVLWRATDRGGRRRSGVPVAIGTTVLLAYPVWFTADRANIEGVVWAFSALGLWLLLCSRFTGSAICLGIAAAIKPFPVLFLLLLVRKRRYKEAAVGCVVACVLTVAALTSLGPNPLKAYRDLAPGLTLYLHRYITNVPTVEETRFDHSLLDGMKLTTLMIETKTINGERMEETVTRLYDTEEGRSRVGPAVRLYGPIVAIAFITLILVFYKLPVLNQVTALSVAITVLPLSSAEYSLLALYIPFGAFLVFTIREAGTAKTPLSSRAMMAIGSVYALLLSPFTFFKIYAGDAKLVLLLALLFLVARVPMRSASFGDQV